MTIDEFGGTVVPVIRKLWAGKAFAESWNDENQRITFRVFSRFPAEEIVEAFRSWKAENLDAREPKWGVIFGAMKSAHGDTATGRGPGVEFPSGPMLDAWSRDKSDGDLTHLWFIVADRYRNTIDNWRKWWAFLESCPLRCDARVGLCWAADQGFDLGFKNGSGEWLLVVNEIDASERRRAVEDFKVKRQPLKPKPKAVESAAPVAVSVGDLADEPPVDQGVLFGSGR